ncbi:unnamed protein product [Mytilus coruscus]|uniref:RNase H type-1 domain-containing protein n=1 Tax=Mytilus coruscus TaxID=42192 RepID=A0A6J8CDK6_MYTCO|nr:unnamed protein product [Mytilus coruscus]
MKRKRTDYRLDDLYCFVYKEEVTHLTNAFVPEADEELSPSLENLIVLTWLRLINRDLPNLVKQRYGTELRSKTLASLKPEISQALDSLLDEIHSATDAKSKLQANVLTDSKPCVQGFEKLCRGEFSASPRVTSFLSVVKPIPGQRQSFIWSCKYSIRLCKQKRTPVCTEPNCQVCCFISRTEDSVVRAVSIQDVLNDEFRLPFTTRSAWINIQSECPDLRRTHAHLKQGTRPSKKLTNIKDVKRYLNVASIANDGLLVVRRCDPLAPPNELIIVPRSVLDRLVTALHINNNWKLKSSGKDVKNKELWSEIDNLLSNINVSWVHVARDSEIGQIEADKLAKLALNIKTSSVNTIQANDQDWVAQTSIKVNSLLKVHLNLIIYYLRCTNVN